MFYLCFIYNEMTEHSESLWTVFYCTFTSKIWKNLNEEFLVIQTDYLSTNVAQAIGIIVETSVVEAEVWEKRD